MAEQKVSFKTRVKEVRKSLNNKSENSDNFKKSLLAKYPSINGHAYDKFDKFSDWHKYIDIG